MRTIVSSGGGGNTYPVLTGLVPKIYDKKGNYTYTVPSNVSMVYALVFGAGGGGSQQTSSGLAFGGGGGGFSAGFCSVTSGENIAVTIGAGGAGAIGNGAGSPGGSSSFGTFLSATGGLGGPQGAIGTVGGSGGTGSIDGTVTSGVTASGGRGGGIPDDNSSTCVISTGGGASGSLLGDGGRGGDAFSSNTSGTISTGGGGWGMGHGGDGTKTNSGDLYCGGGGALSPAGLFLNGSTSDYYGTGSSTFMSGGNKTSSTGHNFGLTGGPGMNNNNNTGFTWWSLLTGGCFGFVTRDETSYGVAVGQGGSSFTNYAVGGGMCAGAAGREVSNHSFTARYFSAGGGGNRLNNYYNGEGFGSVGNASGAGGVAFGNYPFSGGDGIVFIFPVVT